MTARKQKSSGRTTPKGTKNPTKKAKSSSGRGGAGPGAKSPRRAGHDPSKQWVARPETHNRGNR